jgi:hypothetical protein
MTKIFNLSPCFLDPTGFSFQYISNPMADLLKFFQTKAAGCPSWGS